MDTQQIGDAIRPRLKEYFDGFVLAGLKPNPDGTHDRVVIVVGCPENTAIQQQLHTVVTVASHWAMGNIR